MKTQRRILLVLTTLAAFSLVSCQKLKQYQPPAQEGNTSQSTEGGSLAHTAEFKSTKLHGTRYLLGEASCFTCHDGEAIEGPESPETASEIPMTAAEREKIKEKRNKKKACASCHESFPHGKQFKRKHGQMYFDDPQSCLKCHGEKQEGRGRAVACATCHEASHTPEFKLTRVHGAKFIEERSQAAGAVSCWKCHTDKKPRDQGESEERGENGRSSKRSCGTCHENFPHPKNFDDSKKHGKAFRENSSDCAVCHGRDFEGAGQSISCKDCHEFPHVGAWGLPSKHGQAFMKEHQGNGAMVGCTECHTKGSRVSCSTCHFWHLPTGLEPHVPNAQKFQNGCTNCHTGAKRLLPYDKGCFECHLETTELKVPKDWETLPKESGRSPQSVFFKKTKAQSKR